MGCLVKALSVETLLPNVCSECVVSGLTRISDDNLRYCVVQGDPQKQAACHSGSDWWLVMAANYCFTDRLTFEDIQLKRQPTCSWACKLQWMFAPVSWLLFGCVACLLVWIESFTSKRTWHICKYCPNICWREGWNTWTFSVGVSYLEIDVWTQDPNVITAWPCMRTTGMHIEYLNWKKIDKSHL
jgi:hypothetical protein